MLITTLLDNLRSRLRVGAKGSISFVMHLASALLFGGFWAALIAATSTFIADLAYANARIKTVFNVAQRMLAVTAACALYMSLGGSLPPIFLAQSGSLASSVVQRELGVFFVLAVAYFLINSAAVSIVVALSTERAFREVWSLNTRGVAVYDLGASTIAIFVAWLYGLFESWWGFGSIGLLGVIVPIIAIRHVYGLYYQLQDSGQELLQVMVKAIEARDPYTSGHSLRVSILSRGIASEFGLPAKEIEQVETAALLHDVGKIYEEFAPLLRKESRLTSEETALMQTHAVRSAELVGIISKFHGSVQASVRHHHERWDGMGYPDGLKGADIPLGARIILISDTIDAMTTDRPYRKRLPLDVVIAELQRCKGTQFDPDLIDVVVSSVAVRRLIVGAGSSQGVPIIDEAPGYSRRVPWPKGSIWKSRRAL